MKKLLLVVLVLAVAGGGWLAHGLRSRPSVEPYEALSFPAAPAEAGAGSDPAGMRVTFLGVSTLLVRDAAAAILVDGFFSRPGLAAVALGRVGPDEARIDAALARAGIDRLDAVVTVHSHYDHAMDTPLVARKTGAIVVGSESTANIARGQGLAEDRIRVVRGTATMRFGDIAVTLVPSRHFPHGQAMGEIGEPLAAPARATDYLEGGSYSLLFERAGRAILVQGSAGYVEGALVGRRADVAYLGVGLLGSKDDAYRDAYWRETVGAVGAKRVIPIHWDDFLRGLDEPLVALPYLFDDLDASMDFVLERAKRDGIDVRWPALAAASDPFAGL